MKDINATVLIDLRPAEKIILKTLQKDARWGIGRAKRGGLITYESNDETDWKNFYEIYKVAMKEGGANIHFLKDLQRNCKIFFICKKENKVVGGVGIWFLDKYDIEIPRLYFIASSKSHFHLQPNNLLYWACVKWCKNKGYKKFDFGGWQINAQGHLKGINKFKEKWGYLIYYHQNYPFYHALGRKIIRNSKTARKIWDMYKGRR